MKQWVGIGCRAISNWRCAGGVMLALVFACQRMDPQALAEKNQPDRVFGAQLPSRADVVAISDDLALRAQSATGRDRNDLLSRAAKLRERMWRLERRSADALEAADLYKQVGASGDCFSDITGAVLNAEYSQKPAAALALPGASANPACSQRVSLIRSMLAAFADKPNRERPEIPNTKGLADSEEPAQPTVSSGTDVKLVQLQKIEKYVSTDSARVVVWLSAPTTFRAGDLLESEEAGLPHRLYLDVDRATQANVAPSRHEGLLQGVRIAQHGSGTRVVLDLKHPVARRVFYELEPFRLIIDLVRQDTVRFRTKGSTRRVERLVLDPGHGGSDPGAIGPRGLREKDVTLDIAHRAAPLIARELGIATMLTRDVDEYVALDERTAHANAFGADLFISIHCNAAYNTGSDGIVTFVLDGSSDAAAARVAALENSASAAASEELASVFRRSQDAAVLDHSVQFAQLLQRATVASLQGAYGHISDQGVRRAGFYVLAGAAMPAALFEVSFISNPDAEIRLNTGDYRQKLADGIVNAVRAYREGL